MYNDLTIIKEKLEFTLLNQFSEQVKNDVFLLIDNLTGKDTFIDDYLFINLQNILSLKENEAHYFIKLALELSQASFFAPVLLLEKIPTLTFYGVAKEVGKLLSNIKDYGARAVSLFLGSDQLKVDDLIDVLEQSTISFYKALLDAVNNRHHEFGIACSFIMRYSAKIETVISVQNIDAYLDICSMLVKQYGPRITEQYIRNTPEIISFIPLEKTIFIIEDWAKKSLGAAEFVVTYPKIAFTSFIHSKARMIDCHSNAEAIKALKLEILQTENYLTALEHPFLFNDPDFAALILVWPTSSLPLKKNVLFQLQKDNYKNYIFANTELEHEQVSVNQATHSNWLKSWTFCGEVVDLVFIRKRIGRLLQEKHKFSIEPKTIIKKHNIIFDRSIHEYDDARVSSMLEILFSYCIDTLAKDELTFMADFILGKRDKLKKFLSQTTLVLQTWERDPWVDYGRSDELYSCTGIGDYNAANAPGFLADLNMNKLDIWSGGAKVGRIHFCLIKDFSNKSLLLLDCLDGTERILASKKKFELIMTAVSAYARWLGIQQIKVNYDVDFNTTPKKFIAYIEKILQEKNRIDFFSRFLTSNTSRKLLPYPCQTFLESFSRNNGAFIRGAMISL